MNIQNVYQEVNIKMVRGDTLSFYLEFDELESVLSSAAFTCKDAWDGIVQFQKTLSDGITADGSVYHVKVNPSDTSGMSYGQYVYDLQIGVDTDIYTLIKGRLQLTEEATT